MDQLDRYASNIVTSIHKSYYAHLETMATHTHKSSGIWDFISSHWFIMGSGVVLTGVLAT
jgi:hypothetical protein